MPSPVADSDPHARLRAFLLAILLLIAGALRAWTAWPNPTRTRFADESSGVANIASAFETGSLRPTYAFHPSLAYLPQVGLLLLADEAHQRWGWPTNVWDERNGLLPLGYRVCRAVNVLLGIASLALVYLLGRELAGGTVGLLAAALLAAVPWHLRQSIIFKPDMVLFATGGLVLLLSLRAVERPTRGAFVATGAALGLCLASKFNAVAFAVPLVVGSLTLREKTWRERLGWLVLAGVTALTVLIVVDPWLLLDSSLYRQHFGHTLRHYDSQSRMARTSAWDMPVHAVRSLLDPSFHGPVVGGLAIVSLVALSLPPVYRAFSATRVRDWRSQPIPPQRRGWLVLLSFVVAYVGLYSLATSNPSIHNWLPLAAVTSIAAAWVGERCTCGVITRAPKLASPWLAAPLAIAALALLAWPMLRWAYVESVPATTALAERELRRELEPLPGRVVLSEVALRPSLAGPNTQAATIALTQADDIRIVERLAALPSAELELADALVFVDSRLRGDDRDAELYRRLAAGDRARRFTASPLRRRGEGIVCVLQPLELIDTQVVRLARGAAPFEEVSFAVPIGALISIQVDGRSPQRPGHLESMGRRIPCPRQGQDRQSFLCTTDRLRAAGSILFQPAAGARQARVRVLIWRDPRSFGQTSSPPA